MNGHLEPITLSQYLDDALPPEQRNLAAHHLGACPRCANRLADLSRLDRAVRGLPVPPVPDAVFVLAGAAVDRRRRRRLPLGIVVPLPPRARQPVAGGGVLVQPTRPWWAAPTAALALAAGLLVVSVSLICRGYPSLAACAESWPGGVGRSVTRLSPPVLITPVVRLGPPGVAPPRPSALALGEGGSTPAGAGRLGPRDVTPGPAPASPGPPVVPLAGSMAGATETPPRMADGGSIAYPGPAGPVRAASPVAPALRKTQAAVAAGLATLAAEGGLARVYLPRTDDGR